MEQEGGHVAFLEEPVDMTKRGILRFLAAVYDPLGTASSTTLMGRLEDDAELPVLTPTT